MIVVCAIDRPRSAIISTRSRKLSLKRKYHLTHNTMILRSKCRPSNGSSKPGTRPSPALHSPDGGQDREASINRIRAVMHHCRGERDSRKSIAPSRKLWTALRALNRYLIGQSAWLVNYAERHRAELRVGTAITEGTANFLVNRRMAKSQQMRW